MSRQETEFHQATGVRLRQLQPFQNSLLARFEFGQLPQRGRGPSFTGRRLRLSAATAEGLGRALAALLAEGLELETYRTPAGTLERAMRETV